MLIKHLEDFDWEDIAVLEYKDPGSHYQSITRRVLCEGMADVPCQLRYFEIAPEGHSTLEHHEHAHLVVVFRGHGQALLGDRVHDIGERDVVTIPAHTWHQFRASRGETLGFLCLVNVERDRPALPTDEDLMRLRQDPAIASFIRI